MELYPAKSAFISNYWRDKYERDASRYWDKFYLRNSDKFFKDRHYLDKEWGDYFKQDPTSENKVLLEVGCGVGNTVFPLLAEYPHLFVHACDFSPRAIRILQENEQHTVDRVHAFVCDITSDDLGKEISLASVDIVSMVFMLSAVSPDKMPGILQNLKTVMKPGGHVLFRDYAAGDLAEERLRSKDQQISDNFFVRGDGTRAFYFSESYLTTLFLQHGFTVKALTTVCKVVENRSKGLKMDRRWIQAVFCLEKLTSTLDDNFPEEHDVDLEGSVGMNMFVEAPIVEESEVELEQYKLRFKCIPRVHQHTCRNTGLMLWESALAYSRLLLECPALVSGKNVLELGCGCVGLCSLFTSLSSRKVLATDCDEEALKLLRDNFETNSNSFPVDRISSRKLTWGNSEEIQTLLLEESPGGFEMVVGTDVTYVSQALGSLFLTASALLCRPTNNGDAEPMLLLCHLARKVGEWEILEAAHEHGFKLKCNWLMTDELPPLIRQMQQKHVSPSTGISVQFLLFTRD